MSVLVRPRLKAPSAAAPAAWKTIGLRAVAAFLLLWTPFFVFLAHREHPVPPGGLLYSAGWCLLAALVLSVLCGRAGSKRQTVLFAGLFALVLDVQFDWYEDATAYIAFGILLALFWVLRRHISTILAAMFGAVLVSTAAFGSLEPYVERQVIESGATTRGSAGTAPRGIILHLMLDEHAGVMGIPRDIPGGEGMRHDLREFFTTNGFRLFGNAFSEYEATRNSMAGILNFTAGPTPYDFYEGRRPFVLKQSRYFEALAEAGYNIRVYQTLYMDYCREFPALVSHCYIYRHDGTNWLKASNFDDVEKLNVLFSMYLKRSNEMVETALKHYVKLAQDLRNYDLHLPDLPKWDDGPGSVNAVIAFDHIVADVVKGPHGTVYFAHLLVPHGPYTHRSDCSLRDDVNDWRSNRPPFRRANSESERQRSYADYFDQMQCVQQKLAGLFEQLKAAGRFDDAIIIIHGDHGSRIYNVPARAHNIERMQQRDYLAGYATLFAVKSPLLQPGYDTKMLPVSRLLPRVIGRADLAADPDAPIRLYLEGDDDFEPWTPVPLPFSD